jgi:biotin transport system substrate-specific component
VKIDLPGNPVPITAQVFMVLLAGGLLGSRLGALSIIEYLAMGTLGLPVFAAAGVGLAAWGGPTAGYLMGFVAAAWVIGRVCESRGWRRQRTFLAAAGLGVAIIYAAGGLWLAGWLHVTTHAPVGDAFARAWQFGIAPFLAVDALKALAASQVMWAVGRVSSKQ